MTARPRAAALQRRLTPKILYLLSAAALGFLGALWATRPPAPSVGLAPLPTMAECLRDTEARLGAARPGLDRLREASDLCWQQIRSQGTLDGFEIRRLAFLQRYAADPVLLWMAVVVTLIGMALAGVGLLAAFEIAAASMAAPDTAAAVRRGRAGVTSSIAGLLVLAASLAFFLAFARLVARADRIDPDRPAEAAALPAAPPARAAALRELRR